MFSNDSDLELNFRKLYKTLLDADVEKIGISELKAANSSRVTEKLLSGNYSLEFRTKVKVLGNLTASQKCDLYLLIRILHLKFPENKRISYYFLDISEYYKKKMINQSPGYFYLSTLDDIHFKMYIRDILGSKNEIRFLSRRIHMKINEKGENLLDLLLRYLQEPIQLIFISKHKPKELQRHKGYRDHGSLGSEFSRTIRDQARDYTIQERFKEELKRKTDLAQFIEGFLD